MYLRSPARHYLLPKNVHLLVYSVFLHVGPALIKSYLASKTVASRDWKLPAGTVTPNSLLPQSRAPLWVRIQRKRNSRLLIISQQQNYTRQPSQKNREKCGTSFGNFVVSIFVTSIFLHSLKQFCRERLTILL